MAQIDIVGLGPGSYGQLTLETMDKLRDGRPNYFRTKIHPVVAELEARGITCESFDSFYEHGVSFDEVYAQIAETLVKKAAAGESLVYAVPGNPLFGEQSVVNLMALCDAQNIDYAVFSGVSFVDVSMSALKADAVAGLKVIDAFEIATQRPDKNMGNLITQVFDRHMASEVKLSLMDLYDPEFEVVLLIAAGIPGEERILKLPLCEIDWVEGINHLTTLYVPPCPENLRDLGALLAIMATLRSPEGCPWDRKQTHDSLKPYLIEEAYEVLEAVEADDIDNLVEELGDVLFQVVFHAQLGKEEGFFTINDVIEGIAKKMIRRHPHVFKTPENLTADKVLTNWDEIKKQEKHTETIADEMARIPKSFTALMEAAKVQSKASKVGFDWDDPKAALAKVEEERQEVAEELAGGDTGRIEEELGDLFFAAVNVARLAGVQPEIALRKATRKFAGRFKAMENMARQEGKRMEDYDLDGLETLWSRVKSLKN